MDNDRLYIPYGLTTEPEQFSGFGKKEVRHCVAGIAFFGVVAALIYLFTANLTAVMATAIIGIAASIMMTRRDGTSQGDIIQIVSVDDADDTATVYDELQYVEVLTTTASNGSDDVYQDGKVNEGATDDGDDEENELYVATISSSLGHSSISTTTNIYCHSFKKAQAKAGIAVAAALNLSPTATN